MSPYDSEGSDLSFNDDRLCTVLDWPELSISMTPQCTSKGPIRASLYSSDGNYIIIAGQGSPEIEVFDSTTKQKVKSFQLVGSSVMSLALTADNSRLACGDGDGFIHIFDIATGSKTLNWLVEERKPKKRWIWDVRFSQDGQFLVSDGPEKTVAIWDANTGETIALLEGHKYRLTVVALSPDDKWIASGGIDATVRLWDLSTRSEARTYEQKMDCQGLKIQGIRTSSEDLPKFLIERGALQE